MLFADLDQRIAEEEAWSEEQDQPMIDGIEMGEVMEDKSIDEVREQVPSRVQPTLPRAQDPSRVQPTLPREHVPRPEPMNQYVYIDGSLSTSDRRVRRAGWGVAVLTTDAFDEATEAQLHEAWYGDLDGRQTAATAELAALWWALSLVQNGATITIITDCALVAGGWAKGKHLHHQTGPHAAWWARIKEAYDKREGKVKVDKCYSHLDLKTAQELEQPLLWTLGNEIADAMAQQAAKRAAEPLEAAVRTCADVDSLAKQIHRRIAAIQIDASTMTATEILPPRKPSNKTSKVLDREALSGHLMRRRPQNRQWQCALCGRGPGRGSLLDWLQLTRCHAAQASSSEEVVQQVRHRFGPHAKVHDSHALNITGRILWCQCCGSYADSMLRSLTVPCRPPTKKGACNLGRLLKGKHPKTGQTLARGEDQVIVELDEPPASPRGDCAERTAKPARRRR